MDPERFREQGHALVDRLADYLAQVENREGPVLPTSAYGSLAPQFPAPHESPSIDLATLVERMLAHSNHLHHPRYIGHQVTSPLPVISLLAMTGTLLNNGMAVYDMGPAATQMELVVLRFLAERLGWDDRALGVLTSGGSLGNLTALLAARRARTTDPNERLALLVSEQAHYSVERAALVMGWGPDGVVKVPVDDRLRLDPKHLASACERAEKAGRRVIAVVGSACSTTAGAFDPLEPLADFCEQRGLWFHVDGAHGASAALSSKYRPLLKGIERADSVVWDAHKMMLVPALITAVLFKDGRNSHATFAQEADYLFRRTEDLRESEYNVGRRTIECTKRSMSLELYGALAVHGTQFFDDYVTGRFDLGKRFAEMLRAEPDFEVPIDPECNIVCFRYLPAGDAQAEIAQRLADTGRFYVVSSKISQKSCLRVTIINPLTSEEDLRALVVAIRERP